MPVTIPPIHNSMSCDVVAVVPVEVVLLDPLEVAVLSKRPDVANSLYSQISIVAAMQDPLKLAVTLVLAPELTTPYQILTLP